MLGHTLAKAREHKQGNVHAESLHAKAISPNWAFQRTLRRLIALRALPGRR